MNFVCKNRHLCRCPNGPVQPPENFTSPAKALCDTCRYCREWRAQLKARHKAKYGLIVERRASKYDGLPSNATITPEHQQQLNQWIANLIQRTEGITNVSKFANND